MQDDGPLLLAAVVTDGDNGPVMGEARTDRHAALSGALLGLGDGLLHEWVSGISMLASMFAG